MARTKRAAKILTDLGVKPTKISSDKANSLSSDCWYDGMNHQQLHLALAVPPLQFPHGPQQKKQKKSH